MAAMFDELLEFVKDKEGITSGTEWFVIRDFLPEPEKPGIRHGPGYEGYRGRYHVWYKRKALLEEALRVLDQLSFVELQKDGYKGSPRYRFLEGEHEKLLERLASRASRNDKAIEQKEKRATAR